MTIVCLPNPVYGCFFPLSQSSSREREERESNKIKEELPSQTDNYRPNMQLKPLNTLTVTLMLFFTFFILFFSGFLEFPSVSSSIQNFSNPNQSLNSDPDPFTDLLSAFKKWDSQMGCARFRENHKDLIHLLSNRSGSLQEAVADSGCSDLKMEHASVLVKGWTWIPDNLDNLYSCRCGITCLWTKSSVLADKPDALLFETTTPPLQMKSWSWKC